MQRQFDRTLNILKLLVIANDFAEFFEVNDTSTFDEQSRGPNSVTLSTISKDILYAPQRLAQKNLTLRRVATFHSLAGIFLRLTMQKMPL